MTAEALRERTLLFPDEPGLGVLWVPGRGSYRSGWESRGRAQGRVVVDPPQQKLRAELSERAASRPGGLSFLLSWDPFAVQELHLEGSSINDETVAMLGHLVGLEGLHLKGCHVTARGLSHLASLSRLATLTLLQCPVQDDVFAIAAQFSALTRLWLTDCPITGQGVEDLARLPALAILGLARAPLEEAHLGGLSALVGLTELGCFETPLTDAVLPNLYPLTRLATLKASQCDFTTRGLLQLKRHLPALREVELRTVRSGRGPSIVHGRRPVLWTGWSEYATHPTGPAACVPWPPRLPHPECVSNLDVARVGLPAGTVRECLQQGCASLGPAGTSRLEGVFEAQLKQKLPVMLTADILVALVPPFVEELRRQAGTALFSDLEALVAGLSDAVSGTARSAFVVAAALLAEDPLRPRVQALLGRLFEFTSDDQVTASGQTYQNWPAREHHDEWWKLIRENPDLFEELKLEKSWPARRDNVLQALQRYLDRPVVEPEADAVAERELERLAAGQTETCELSGLPLDYGSIQQIAASSGKARKYLRVVRWLSALEWPADHAAAQAVAAALDTSSFLREKWERVFMLETLLSDASGPTLLHGSPGPSLLGRRANPWQSPDVIQNADAGNFPQVWGWMLQGLLEDANAAETPAFMSTLRWRTKTATTIMGGVLLAGPPTWRAATKAEQPGAGGDRPALEAWVEPMPRFLSRLSTWLSTVQVALNALDVSSVDLNGRLNRLHAVVATLQAAILRQQSGQYLTAEACRELTDLCFELPAALAEPFHVAVGAPRTPELRLAVGCWQRMLALCPLPDGTAVMAAGPVLPVYDVPLDTTLLGWAAQQPTPTMRLRPWEPSHG